MSKWDGRIAADARRLPIADESVQCAITSPPYWGLRRYNVSPEVQSLVIGNEPTLEAYIENIVAVFREVRRVLKPDGVIWVNMGDAYANGKAKEGYSDTGHDLGWNNNRSQQREGKNKKSFRRDRTEQTAESSTRGVPGLKPKDLIGLPWMVAFALRNDGWWLRQEIIWHKTQAMPESTRDRPTRAHEQIFLLAKSLKYFYDADAIKTPASPDTHDRYKRANGGHAPSGQSAHCGAVGPRPNTKQDGHGRRHAGFNERYFGEKSAPEDERLVESNGRFYENTNNHVDMVNKRSVWSFGTAAYPDAHYAVFPPDLVEPCILAGSRPGDIVLDPFFGSGTVGVVAERFNRRWIGCDLGYQELQAKRLTNVQKELILEV